MTDLEVLLVDDSEELRNLMGIVLDRQPGWHVCGDVANGRAAIDEAEHEKPDVVLLDIAMPVMDGLEALPLIKEAAPDAVVVMLSAYPEKVVGPRAIEAGAHGYIEKGDLTRSLIPELGRIVTQVRAGRRTA